MEAEFSEPVHMGLSFDQFTTPPESPDQEDQDNKNAVCANLDPSANDGVEGLVLDDSDEFSDDDGVDALKSVNTGIKQQFTSISSEMEEIRRKNQQALDESQAAVKALTGTLGEFKEHVTKNRQLFGDRVDQLKRMKQELKDVCEKTASELIPQKESMEEGVKVQEELLQEMNKLLESQGKAVCAEQGELERQLTMLEECTGLQIRALSGNRVQLILHHLSEEEPEREGNVQLKMEGDQYTILSCVPPLSNIDELTEKLCSTNNLQKFVVELRKGFKTATFTAPPSDGQDKEGGATAAVPDDGQ